jgi:hypothetical protein
MEEIRLTTTQYFLYGTLIGAGLGFLFGLIPVLVGIRKNNRQMGLYGLLASTVCGALFPPLSLVVVAVFLWLILRKSAAAGAENVVIEGDDVSNTGNS